MRYALIVPRLLAPHANRGAGSELRPDQALALAVQLRLANLHDYCEEFEDVPNIAEMAGSSEWGWRFVGAFLSRLLDDDFEPLVLAATEAPDGASRAAATVAAACALLEADRIDDGLDLLNGAVSWSAYECVDRAWLEAQRARLDRQVGNLDEALATARGVREALAAVEEDATADAIDAGAAALILSIRKFEAADFEAAVRSGDTVAAWWRTQEIASGNERILERSFEQWARDRSTTIAREDAAANRLLAAAIETNHALDQGGWANRMTAIGRDALVRLERNCDPEEAAEGLGSLRRGGNEKALRLAVARLLSDGPAAAVGLASSAVHLGRSTHTGVLADLTLLEHGGDVLDPEIATGLAGELLGLALEPGLLAERTTPTFLLDVQLVESLAGVILAAGAERQRQVVEHLPGFPPQRDYLAARAWANLLWTIPRDSWKQGAAKAAAGDAERHDPVLARALRGVAWRHDGDAAARAALVEEALAGSVLAVGELGNLSHLEADLAVQLIDALAAAVRDRTVKARSGSVSFGGPDPAEALAVLDLWHSESADWEPLVELFAEKRAPVGHKQRALLVLAASPERIPETVRARLRPALARLIEGKAARTSPFGGEADGRGPALDLALAIGVMDEERAGEIALDWLSGSAERRRWAAHVGYRLGRPEDIGLLAALANDSDPTVRAAASAALAAKLPLERPGERILAGVMRQAVRDPGVEVPRAIAGALAASAWRGALAQEIRGQLSSHISAAVRAIAASEPEPGAEREPSAEPQRNPYARMRLEQLRRE